MAKTCVVFSCQECGHREAVAEPEYNNPATYYKKTAVSGNVLKYRPVPDSFECPECEGDMFLMDAHVSTEDLPDGTVLIRVEAETITLTEYESEQQRLMKANQHEEALNEMVELLKPLVEDNVRYLERMEGKQIGATTFHTDPGDRPAISLVNQITRFVGRATGWSLERAMELSFSILEDVNMHTEAHEVGKLLASRNRQSKTMLHRYFKE